jgi:uncharacterized protein (TIGR03663 family)
MFEGMSQAGLNHWTGYIRRNWAALAILLAGAMLRLALLGMKPPHFDEGVNGWFVDQMTKNGYFEYDPNNYHGPLHFYILFLFQTLFGRHIWALRLPTVFANLATIWLITRFDRFLPRRACLAAALALALSPAEVFYSRYAIHEAELALFLLLTTWGIGVLWQSGERKGLWATGLGISGMLLTKETYIIHLACFGLTILTLWVWDWICRWPLRGRLCEQRAPLPEASQRPPTEAASQRQGAGREAVSARPPAEDPAPERPAIYDPAPVLAPQRWTERDLAVLAGWCLFLVLFFYSGNFLDFRSLKGLYLTYAAWVKTGTQGNGHDKLWPYWLELMGKFEWPAAIGLLYGVGACLFEFVNGLMKKIPGSRALSWPGRFIAVYGAGALVAYSLVPYKTPWCIVTILWPFFLLFGIAIERLWSFLGRWAVAALCLPLLGATLGYTVWLNFYHFADEEVFVDVPWKGSVLISNSYVYVQTTTDLDKITEPLFEIVAQDPANYNMRGLILLSSYYPLPWVLGDFAHVAYYSDGNGSDTSQADFLMADSDRVEKIEPMLKEPYFKESFRLRGGMEPSELYLRASKFQQIFPGRDPEFQPE